MYTVFMKAQVNSEQDMQKMAEKLAEDLTWPFCLEIIGDVGAGKTTFVKGLARALGSSDDVSSPSFTLNNRYDLPEERVLSHYDFYRLSEGGVMHESLNEDLNDVQTSVVVEWGETIGASLPAQRYVLHINYLPSKGREIIFGEIL